MIVHCMLSNECSTIVYFSETAKNIGEYTFKTLNNLLLVLQTQRYLTLYMYLQIRYKNVYVYCKI